MSDRTNLVYRYDGTFNGLMCCVFESIYCKEEPAAIEYSDEEQATIFEVKYIETNDEKAARVKKSIPLKISKEAEKLVKDTFLTCLVQKELKILRFLKLGYKLGARTTKLSVNPDVSALDKAVLHMSREAHLLLGFLRFSEYGDFLFAEIGPKNNQLPILAPHFCSRFSGENFVIFDRTHKLLFLHKKDGETSFSQVDNIEIPEPDENEEKYRKLWRSFCDTIAVEGRINPKLQRNLMPKRYWPYMEEVRGKL